MKLGFDNMFVVDCVGKGGGLALFWGEESGVEIQNFSHRHINAIIRNHPHSLDWKFTGFYGHPVVAKRHEAWELMKYLAKLQPYPWMCVGDFNKVMTMSEKSGGNLRQWGLMQAFQQTLEDCELTDLGYCGPKFTWTNCQEGEGLIRERLDRGLANSAWRSLFPDMVIFVSVSTNSDHAPLLFILEKFQTQAYRKPRFHFEASWAAEKKCQEIIERIWKQPTIMARKWEGLE
jgi:hypothetical protein